MAPCLTSQHNFFFFNSGKFSRNLQIKLDQPVSAPASPRDANNGEGAPANSTPEQLTSHIQWLRNEVARLKHQLTLSLQERKLFCFFVVSSFYFFFKFNLNLSLKCVSVFGIKAYFNSCYRRGKNGSLCPGRKTYTRRKSTSSTSASDGNGAT
jgi:hypothetical protein